MSFIKEFREYYVLIIGFVLCLIFMPVAVVGYPAYEAFRTEAPETVSMVINHVIGAGMRLDNIFKVAGFILVALGSGRVIGKNKKFGPVVFWALSAALFRLLYMLMPFFFNGSMRFRVGYVLYFIALAFEIITLFMVMLAMTRLFETLANHSYNNVTVIFGMLSTASGLVFHIIWFYDIVIVGLIYYAAQVIFAFVYCYRIWKDRGMLEQA